MGSFGSRMVDKYNDTITKIDENKLYTAVFKSPLIVSLIVALIITLVAVLCLHTLIEDKSKMWMHSGILFLSSFAVATPFIHLAQSKARSLTRVECSKNGSAELISQIKNVSGGADRSFGFEDAFIPVGSDDDIKSARTSPVSTIRSKK